MKQLIVDLKSGEVIKEEVPVPALRDGYVLIRNTRSIVSLGTEKMLVDFGRSSLLGKARQHRDRVQDVLAKIRTDGLQPTLKAVSSKLSRPIALGYSSCGVVAGVGANVAGYKVGDRVASNGAHGEYVSVPKNLTARIPDEVDDDGAAFTVLASVALQGIRLLNVAFGETVAVIGLGLIGQLAVQLLKAAGSAVIGIDPSETKRKIAAPFCIKTMASSDEMAGQVKLLTKDTGVDAVLITAATKSNDVISSAAQMCRKRGRVVLTGVVGLDLRRSDFYEKEITFQVSAAYGPGRYDAAYEEHGQDYPIGYVRWTAQRNFEAVLSAMAAGQLTTKHLISSRKNVEDAPQFYTEMGNDSTLACLIDYPESHAPAARTIYYSIKKTAATGGRIGIIGAGNFTESTLLPILQKQGAAIHAIADGTGLNAARLAKKYGIGAATTDYRSIINDPAVDAVMITTRHHLHATMTVEALNQGKHVFVEKPLGLSADEIASVAAAYTKNEATLTIGFNRRFAPLMQRMADLLTQCSGPKHILITCNASRLPPQSWISDPLTGGGRIRSEGCHFIDLAGFIAGSVCAGITASGSDENAHIVMAFADGSTSVINYLGAGHKGYDKERVEVHSSGKSIILENWRKLTGYGFAGFDSKTLSQDKGHAALLHAWLKTIGKGGEGPISFTEIFTSSMNTIRAADALISRAPLLL